MKNTVRRTIFILSFCVVIIVAGPAFLDWYANKPLVATAKEVLTSGKATLDFYKKQEDIKIVFVGDIMLDRFIDKFIENNGPDRLLSEDIRNIFKSEDLVIGNLEGTITTNESVSKNDTSILRFTFKPEYALMLKNLGFTTLSLANNHTLDFGAGGYKQTEDFLDSEGIKHFGSARNDKNLSYLYKVKGRALCFVGYHDLYTYDEKPVLEEIKRIKPSCDYVFLFAHWGEEYKTEVSGRQKELAHRFIDAGVDIIIGSHPHVVQPVEVYKNRAIFYSLGNFIFDQYFSFETTHGLILSIEIGSCGISFRPIATKIDRGAVKIASEEEKIQVLGNTQEFILPVFKDL